MDSHSMETMIRMMERKERLAAAAAAAVRTSS